MRADLCYGLCKAGPQWALTASWFADPVTSIAVPAHPPVPRSEVLWLESNPFHGVYLFNFKAALREI